MDEKTKRAVSFAVTSIVMALVAKYDLPVGEASEIANQAFKAGLEEGFTLKSRDEANARLEELLS